MTERAEGLVPEWDLIDRLRKSLRESGIGTGEMARYLGVHRNTIGNYLNGKTQADTRTLRLWAIRTGVALDWLQTGGNPPDPDGPGRASDDAELPRLDSNQEPSGNRFRRPFRDKRQKRRYVPLPSGLIAA